MFDLVKKLSQEFGVSGNEERIRDLIINEIKDKIDEINIDNLGNLIALKKGEDSSKKIMIAAHMDEIGIMATYIDKEGFIRFSNVGWVSPQYSLGQRVRFINGIVGTIFYEEKLEDLKNLKLSNLYIDIGAKNKEEAEEKIKIGDVACFVGDTVKQEEMIISKALDDRSGCAVMVDTIKSIDKTKNDICFVFTVQEELGLRGAKTAAYGIKPDIAIAIDVTMTGDTPNCKPMEVKCGKGPAIKIKDRSIICHPMVKSLIEEKAKILKIPYQFEILDEGGSGPGSIHITAGGIPSGAISIPCRYLHSPVEKVSESDLVLASKLLQEIIR